MFVVHMTSVHSRFDTRIFFKECRSLSDLGFKVALVVADGFGDSTENGIFIADAGASTSRLNRMLRAPRRVFYRAVELDADLYHFHDPELLFVALRLKAMGKKVIFDSHEDVPLQIMSKPYINPKLRFIVSTIYSVIERYIVKKFDYIIAATPSIKQKFAQFHPNVLDVNNYPLLNELAPEEGAAVVKKNQLAYVGGISALRGIIPLVNALDLVEADVELALVGVCSEADTKSTIEFLPGWRKVQSLGFVDRARLRSILNASVAGIVTYLPAPNHSEAQPNKLFEYLSAGIPVIGSNFPLWAEVIESNQCGICVDPEDPASVARAIQFLLTNQEEAARMGSNGRQAVLQKYNWEIEQVKLVSIYREILGEEAC